MVDYDLRLLCTLARIPALDAASLIAACTALGDLPVLGKLFRSRAYRDRQTELVVFITPRFVAGVNDTALRDDAADVEAARQQAATVRERGDWARERARFVD